MPVYPWSPSLTLTADDIAEFKRLYEAEFNEPLSESDALAKATAVMFLYERLYMSKLPENLDHQAAKRPPYAPEAGASGEPG